ncbi:DUF1588 domain-containing protein [Luminiphilus sp.]|nr:DUF1588 domain-containing protein [Luminiphilus sp.]MDB3923063.1 DUF1588 domain-containing protein [Luminiphilus sp.]
MLPISNKVSRRPPGKMSRAIAFGLALGTVSGVNAYPSSVGNAVSLLCQLRVSAAGGAEAHAQNLYEAADAVVQSKCIGCHIEDGLAPKAGASLSLRTTSDPTYLDYNFSNFHALSEGRSSQYILNKAQGASHGGGAVIEPFSSDYKLLADFLQALALGTTCSPSSLKKTANNSSPDTLWSGVNSLSTPQLYRKAAVVLSRRVPTTEELDRLSRGDITLDAAIDELMAGQGFHDFLVTGANDQLLTDAFTNGLFPIQLFSNWWPGNGATKLALFENLERNEDLYKNNEQWKLWQAQNYGLSRAPVELIAHVVENDKPYTEILTADYTMVTPLTADILNAELGDSWEQAVVYNGEYTEFHKEFKPAKNFGTFNSEPGPEVCIPVQGGDCYPSSWEPFEWPHAGVLNTMAFLQRYPTTETNRNRARARWTYKFFLGLDVEASAARTTDAAALADKNNPTLLNPACTVCHQTLDPVAGAFQNYNETGIFRISGFTDSLPYGYKLDPESGYVNGDTWYRDMRTAGMNGQSAPDASNSLQWLAQQIVADPRFPVATVEFWWPTVMGQAVLKAPEDPQLPNYNEELEAFSLQRYEVNKLAGAFVQNQFKLKALLREMVLSPWFASGEVVSQNAKLFSVARLGTRRLLTPEELDSKTKSLFGFKVWEQERQNILPETITYVSDWANIALGGIDSYQVKSRAREVSSLSLAAVEQHSAGVACVVAEIEAQTVDGQRQYLNTFDFSSTPTDSAELRAVLVNLYSRLHGRSLAAESDDVDLLVDLLLEAQSTHGGNPPCHLWDDLSYAKLADDLDARGVRQPSNTPVEKANTWAWRLIIDYMVAHYDYINE